MVSRRAAATLVSQLLLAQGWRAAVGKPELDRGRANAPCGQRRNRAPVLDTRRRRIGTGSEIRISGIRRCILLFVARAPAAGECRSVRFAARRSDGTRAPGKNFRAGIGAGHRPRAADSPQYGRRALAVGLVVLAQRTLFTHSRRFTHRISPAARLATVGRKRRLPVHSSTRPLAQLSNPAAACPDSPPVS